MKHILNNLSNEEKNSIREQHTGGMKVMTENFSKLLNSKLGDSKPLVSEQTSNNNCLSQFEKIPKGSKSRFGGLTQNDYWNGTYDGFNISINFDGTCTLRKSNEKISAKWKCDNGKFVVYDKKQRMNTID
jgi:hypothetical protein